MNLPHDVLKPNSPPGRGMIDGVEMQVAILGKRADVGSQAVFFREFADAMRRAGIRPAPPIAELPKQVEILPTDPAGRAVLGITAATLGPAVFVPEGVFLVAGPPQTGRSTALRTIAIALRRWEPAIQLHLFSPQRRSPLLSSPLFAATAGGADEVARQAKALADEATDGRRIAVFIENVAELSGGGPADTALCELLRVCRDEGHFVVAEGESASLTGSMGLLGQVKSSRYGLAFGPDPTDGDRMFRTPFPNRLNRADFPPGRALLVRGGTTSVVQVGWTP